ncbi:Methionine synthase B12-binding module cap domain protein (plasmid) [Gemmatirosa kalamazoonensis]|uniref:Methionine synthase B12-binding module cap domain protein n=1 Tax=Gemmatirosa kalamazoonensis TaxID=861299 RepID=W0RSR4_9BACT|nr:MerR family transcriptional regulator [Gemmatirosa kalamazoonensis]AHG93711.1 Methionine synthase B12-binding module cap domain protein [Gemmatirosa kalamazoonensis]
MPRRQPDASAAVHPIQVVTRLTGLSADLIRVWEKRYGVVVPVRTPSGRRLYSDADIERLRLLGRATLAGYSIRRAAALPAKALAALAGKGTVLTDGSGTTEGPGAATPESSAPGAADHLDACLAAIEQFDAVALDAILRRATIALSTAAFLDTVVLPLEARVAARVHDGSLRAPHRHLAHATLRRVLDHLTAAATSPVASPDLVVTTPIGQFEELGALVTAAAAAAEGWRVTYVGAGMPADDAAEAVTLLDARAVALSFGTAPGDRLVARELRRLRSLLPNEVAILVEGAAADTHRAVLGEIGASVLRDLPTLRTRLRALV